MEKIANKTHYLKQDYICSKKKYFDEVETVLLDLNQDTRARLISATKKKYGSRAIRQRIRRRILNFDQLKKRLIKFDSDLILIDSQKDKMKKQVFFYFQKFYDLLIEVTDHEDLVLANFLDDYDFSNDYQILEILKHIKKSHLLKRIKMFNLCNQDLRIKTEIGELEFSRMLDNYKRFKKRQLRCIKHINQIVLALYSDDEIIKDVGKC